MKKLLMLILSVAVVTSFTLAFTACGDGNNSGEPPHVCQFETTWTKDGTHHWYACTDDDCQEVKDKALHEYSDGVCVCGHVDPDYVEDVEVIGFNTLEEVVVTTGTKVVIEQPAPVDQHGQKLDVCVDVIDDDGAHVTIHKDGGVSYFYANGTGYTISYVVYPKDKAKTLKTTAVKVIGSATLEVEYSDVVEIGKSIEIKPSCGFFAPEYTYSVEKEDGTDVPVVDGFFTPDTIGKYNVTVKAESNGKQVNSSYTVFARDVIQKGEVESFYDAWEEYRGFVKNTARGWTVTHTKDSKINNKNGVADHFATYTVDASDQSVEFWLNPTFDVDYYRQLASEGYKSVALYVYTDSDVSIPVRFIADNVDESHLNVEKGGTFVGEWTRIDINLLEDAIIDDCLDRSFISGYSVYKNQRNGFLRFDNKSGKEFNIYISDVFAVKETDVSFKDEVKTEYKVGDLVELDSLILGENGVEYEFYLTNLTAKTPTEKCDKNYTFKAGGSYSVKVIPKNADLVGEANVTFVVTDDVVLEKSWSKVKMTGNSVEVKFSDLGISLKNGNEPVLATVTSVYYHDDYKVPHTDTGFTVDKAGYYKIFVEGSFGDGYKTNKQYDLDVYTEEDALMLANSEDFIATRYWAYQKMPTVGYDEYTVRGVTDTMFSYRASIGAMVVFFRPMYSKAYYQDIIDNNDTCQVLFRFYTENKTGNKLFAKFINTYGQKELFNYDHEALIDLSYFITKYDAFASGYARDLKVVQSAGNPVRNFDTATYDYMFATNNNSGNNIYFRDMPILISYTDETENLINVSTLSNTTFDATTTMNAEAKAVVNGYDQSDVDYRFVDVFGNEVKGKTIDTSIETNKRLWNFQALFGDNVIYSGYVDLYDPTDGFVWNPDKAWTLYTGEVFTNRGNGVSSTMEKDGGTVDTTEFTAKSSYAGSNYLTFANRPIHSKSYYEQYRGKVKFSFSVFFEIKDSQNNPELTKWFAANMLAIHATSSSKTQVIYCSNDAGAKMNNVWVNRTFKLDAMLDKWTYAECENSTIKNWTDRENYGIFFIYNPQNETTASEHSVHVTELTYTVNK